MEDQINIGDQNNHQNHQIGLSSENQPSVTAGKPKVNYWMVSTLILGVLLLVILVVNVSGLGIIKKNSDVITPPPPESPTPPVSSNTSKFTGTVKTGAQLGEVKSHCSNGLYLVADEGRELIDGTGMKMLLLRLPGEPDEPPMLSDQQYVGEKVEVVGKYPAQEVFCQALTCTCEDYILVEHINIADTQSVENRQTKIEGQIDCLPHRDTSGGQTLECTIGLQSEDGMYYGLLGLNQQDLMSGKIAAGQKVVITGIFTPNQDSKYNILGTIKVVAVEYIK